MGILDMDLEQVKLVQKAINLRNTQLREAQAYENQLKMYVGDRVKITGNMQAKWQRGKTGTVRVLNTDDVVIVLDDPYYSSRTFQTTRELRLAYSLVTKIT